MQSDIGKVLGEAYIQKTLSTSLDVICYFKNTYMTELLFEPEKKLELLYG